MPDGTIKIEEPESPLKSQMTMKQKFKQLTKKMDKSEDMMKLVLQKK